MIINGAISFLPLLPALPVPVLPVPVFPVRVLPVRVLPGVDLIVSTVAFAVALTFVAGVGGVVIVLMSPLQRGDVQAQTPNSSSQSFACPLRPHPLVFPTSPEGLEDF